MAGISKKKIKTKDGKEIVKYTITYRDVFGKQHTSGLYDTLKEAKRYLGAFENINPNVKNITYGAIFQAYLNKIKKKSSEGTYKNYKSYFKRLFYKVEDIKYESIDSITWQNFFDELLEKESAYTVQTCLKIAKAAVNYCIKHNMIDYNVFNKIETIELPKADINHLSIQELKTVLKECKKSYPQYYVLLYTFIGTGAREGEIFALNKDDFNYVEKTLTINKQFTKGKLYYKPKTKASIRKISLFEELTELINEHIKTLDNNNPLLFPNNAGNYQDANNFRERFWYKLLELCGIKKRVRLHDLRGSYIDLVLSMGLSIKFAQNQVGHSKSETTLNVYAKNNEDMITKATDTLNDIFQKCENNVRIKEIPRNKKIIQFPKRCLDCSF